MLHTPLADAADIVLPGCAFVEKDATYTNMTGHVQAASRVIPPPGDAGEDWQILMKLGVVFGTNVTLRVGEAIRDAIARELSAIPGYGALASVSFSRPVSARHWLQASNPSERWKWDFMFQDLPPIKFGDDFGPIAASGRHSAQRSEVACAGCSGCSWPRLACATPPRRRSRRPSRRMSPCLPQEPATRCAWP